MTDVTKKKRVYTDEQKLKHKLRRETRISLMSESELLEFRAREKATQDKYVAENKDHVREYQKTWKRVNKVKVAKQRKVLYTPERRYKEHIRFQYKISEAEYNALLKIQDFRCALCEKHVNDTSRRVLFVDHDHTTGKIRGLLCNACNAGIGFLQESPELLFKAVDYIAHSYLNEEPDEPDQS